MNASDFKQAMRHCAGAVALVTVGRDAGRRAGLTVTAVCSLSDDPPSLLVCVNRNASAHPRIREDKSFAVSFLTAEQIPLALTFSGQNGVTGDDRFVFGQWTAGVTGAPMLEDAVVAFDCSLREEYETKTHSIFIGEVRDLRVRSDADPLVYARSNFHGLKKMASAMPLDDPEARKLSWSIFS